MNTSSQEKKKQRLKEYHDICKKIAKQHPQHSFDEGFDFSKMSNEKYTDTLGKKMLDETYFNSENYALTDKVAYIKRVGADLLLAANYLFYLDFDETFKRDLYDLLQTNNHDYVMTIYNYAQNLYACRHGAECGKYSSVVLEKCIQNDAFCVDDFETLVKTSLTAGQQADIDIAYRYLLQMFDYTITKRYFNLPISIMWILMVMALIMKLNLLLVRL
ncbi:MAG: hypothetical protein L3J83_04520 [Proteobacteria bacterium]|nr:hypothetical protein [Pseudomonadota bacterium]